MTPGYLLLTTTLYTYIKKLKAKEGKGYSGDQWALLDLNPVFLWISKPKVVQWDPLTLILVDGKMVGMI